MQSGALLAVVAIALPALAGCSGAPDGVDETASETREAHEARETPATPETDAPSARHPASRVPFLDGAFVSWAESMPVEVEQAATGLPTDRPVVVWAGLDAVHADGADAHPAPDGRDEASPAGTPAPSPR